MLCTRHASWQDDQVEVLRQHVHQHGIGGQPGTTGAGDHPALFDTRYQYLDIGAAQHVDQRHAFEIFDTIGDCNQCSLAHLTTPSDRK